MYTKQISVNGQYLLEIPLAFIILCNNKHLLIDNHDH